EQKAQAARREEALTAQAAKLGIIYLLNFMAILSASLAIFNLLPFPVLDGGHIVLSVIEEIRGKPLPEAFIKPIFMICVVLLIGLMVFVTFYDIIRTLPASAKTPAPVKELKSGQEEAKP
ncbi:MAG: site-2 protease family protein, partial [Lentisphaerae bacterium]|nr:site-2 protease family protein [Lentisphaerota bacterium]